MMIWYSYSVLCFIRIFLTLLPQTGYIHPDEYFQSTEILAGRIFDVETHIPWEFNGTLPIRSMLLPILTVGVPYSVMNCLKTWVQQSWNINLLQPYFLVMIPRLSMTLISFISDFFIYKICLNQNTRPWSTLKIWASSHVTLVFLSRTFSNSTELVLFSALLYFVSSAMKLTHRFIRREVELEDKYRKANNAMERVNIVRQQKKIPVHKYSNNYYIGALFAVGVFNRPTFMLFAVVPLFFWMQRGMFLKRIGLADFHHRMTSLLPTFTIMSFILILADTFFYGAATKSSIWDIKLSRDLVMTPLNFIAYNMDRANLATHGIHPWYLHSAVNVPLLFNVLGLGGLYLMSRALVLLASSPWTAKPELFNFNGLLVFSFAFPLGALSLTPHQEARFLLPLLVPLVLLLGPFLLRREGMSARLMRSFWYAGNVFCVLFFGFFHQGGIYETQHFLHNHIHNERTSLTQTHLLYFHTYMPPLSLLAVPHHGRLVIDEANSTRYRRKKNVFVEDLAGSDVDELLRRCVRLVSDAQAKYLTQKLKSEVFVIFPATLAPQVNRIINPFPLLSWKPVYKSYPHLSMEDPPNFGDLCNDTNKLYKSGFINECNSLFPWLQNKGSQLALLVYQLEFQIR